MKKIVLSIIIILFTVGLYTPQKVDALTLYNDIEEKNTPLNQEKTSYIIYVVHALESDKQYVTTEYVKLTDTDLENGYDLHKIILSKEGMLVKKASYLNLENDQMTEKWSLTTSDFEEIKGEESDYYFAQVFIDYEVMTGYVITNEEEINPVQDPYAIMLLKGFMGGGIEDITFELANMSI